MRLLDLLRLRPSLRRLRRWLRPSVRERIASKHPSGQGLELGALHRAFPVDERRVQVRFIDRQPRESLRELLEIVRTCSGIAFEVVDWRRGDEAETLVVCRLG